MIVTHRKQQRMERIKFQVPASLKAKLDSLRTEGITASGLIRSLLTHHFSKLHKGRKER